MNKPRLFAKKNNTYLERKTKSENYKRRVIIAFEGGKTEPNYFNDNKYMLQSKSNHLVEVLPLERQSRDGKSSPEHVRDGLIEYCDANKDLIDENDSLWIVIDVDRHFGSKSSEKKEKYDLFLKTLKTNKDMDINIAISMLASCLVLNFG